MIYFGVCRPIEPAGPRVIPSSTLSFYGVPMTTATVNPTLGEAPIPFGKTPGGYLFRLKTPDGQTNVKFWRSANAAAVLDQIAPGSYLLTWQREATDTNPIGPEGSKLIEVPDLTPKMEIITDIELVYSA